MIASIRQTISNSTSGLSSFEGLGPGNTTSYTKVRKISIHQKFLECALYNFNIFDLRGIVECYQTCQLAYLQIIGNHKVEVNETEYKKDTDFGTSHVKVSFINVRPLISDTIEPEVDTQTVTTAVNRDRESLEDTVENEIAYNPEVGKDTLPQRLRQA